MNERRSGVILTALALTVLGGVGFARAPSYAQEETRTFPETGKTVKGRFLAYWTANGGLSQQGFPISDELQEVSPTDGKTYTVQYFERAVFEYHPENPDPRFQVLLSLLGNFFYKDKYGTTGAPNQQASTVNPRTFPETGKVLGGRFREYWEANGGLAQQGFPISNEFIEVNDLDGKPYMVQYFERAVFEWHPEQTDPRFQVLLSQLGKFRLNNNNKPSPTPTRAVTNTPVPTNTPQPTTPPPPPPATNTPSPCADTPASRDMIVLPSNCARRGTIFFFEGEGFQPGETVGVYLTAPDQSVIGAPFQIDADQDGFAGVVSFASQPNFPLGVYAITMEGVTSHHVAIGYFKLIP